MASKNFNAFKNKAFNKIKEGSWPISYHLNPKARPSFRDICVELRHIMCSFMVDSTS